MRHVVRLGLRSPSGWIWLPAYRSLTTTCQPGPGGGCTIPESSSTLVAVNGYGVLLWLAIPVIASVLVSGLALLKEPARRLPQTAAAWCVVAAMWVVTLVSMVSRLVLRPLGCPLEHRRSPHARRHRGACSRQVALG